MGNLVALASKNFIVCSISPRRSLCAFMIMMKAGQPKWRKVESSTNLCPIATQAGSNPFVESCGEHDRIEAPNRVPLDMFTVKEQSAYIECQSLMIRRELPSSASIGALSCPVCYFLHVLFRRKRAALRLKWSLPYVCLVGLYRLLGRLIDLMLEPLLGGIDCRLGLVRVSHLS